MKSWQEQCAEIISFLEDIFKETKYRIVFRKYETDQKEDEWLFFVESIRGDGGRHDGTAITWVSVGGKNIEELPGLLLLKAQQRVNEWQQEGLKEVEKKALELEKAKNELDKRLNTKMDSLAKRVNNGCKASDCDSPRPENAEG
jgi:hypothetical protein